MQNQSIQTEEIISETNPRISQRRRFIRVMFARPIVLIGSVIIVIAVLVASLAPFISPYDPYATNMLKILAQPDAHNLFGTDNLGRDILSRIIYGAQISLMVGVVATGIASLIGIILGLLAGYFSGWVNMVIMRFIDMLLALPPLVLVLTIASVIGGGLLNVMLAIGIGMMPTYCRLMCGLVLTIRENDYITAAHSIGLSDRSIMQHHILMNAFPPLLVLITINVGTAILMEASLSFLGIGIQPPTATWGSMVNDGYRYLLNNPLISFIPGVCIVLVSLSFNLIGDGLRDATDPRLRGSL